MPITLPASSTYFLQALHGDVVWLHNTTPEHREKSSIVSKQVAGYPEKHPRLRFEALYSTPTTESSRLETKMPHVMWTLTQDARVLILVQAPALTLRPLIHESMYVCCFRTERGTR